MVPLKPRALKELNWLVPIAEKLLEAPKKAMLLGLTIGYRGLSFMEFSIDILHQHNYCVCGLQMNYPAAELRGIKMSFYVINPDAEHRGILLIKDHKKKSTLLPDVSNNAIHGV